MSDNDNATDTVEVQPDTVELTAVIVSAYVSNNHIQPAELTALISSVHAAVGGLGKAAESAEPPVERPTPAQIKKSITPDALISFLDGKRYKTLKRHLTKHGLDPASYRERFGLPHDYPLTATRYSEARSSLARTLGLGRKRAEAAE
jgi:predicted transcriptional regulator